jgi:hypothetical protein
VWKTNRTRSTKQELTEGQRHDMHVAARIAGKMVKSASRQLGPNAFNSDATVEAKRRKGIEDAKRYALELQSKGVDTGGTYRDKKKNEEL